MWCISDLHVIYDVLSILQVFVAETEWLHAFIYIVHKSSKYIEFAM